MMSKNETTGAEEWVSEGWLRAMYMDLLVFEALTDPKRTKKWRTYKGCATYLQFCKFCNAEARRARILVEQKLPALKCPVCNWHSKKESYSEAMSSLWNHVDRKSWNENGKEVARKDRIHPVREIIDQWEEEHNQMGSADHEIALAKAGHPPDPKKMGAYGAKATQRAIEMHNKQKAEMHKTEVKSEDFWDQVETWGGDGGESFGQWLQEEDQSDEEEEDEEEEDHQGGRWNEAASSSSGWGSFWTDDTRTSSATQSGQQQPPKQQQQQQSKRPRGERGGKKHVKNRENRKRSDDGAKGAWGWGSWGGKNSGWSKGGKDDHESGPGWGPKPPTERPPWPAAPYAIEDQGKKGSSWDYRVQNRNALGGGWTGHWKSGH